MAHLDNRKLIGAPGLREDLFQLMNGLEKTAEREWGQVVSLPDDKRAVEFEQIGRGYDCTQTADDDRLLWLNREGRIEAMFCFIDEPGEVQPFLDVYQKIEEIDCPLTFLLGRRLVCEDIQLVVVVRILGALIENARSGSGGSTALW